MTQDLRREPSRPYGDGAADLVAHARGLRRKLAFWRRTAWLLFGIVLLVLVVAWHQATVRRRECRQALEHYAERARASGLDREPPAMLESQWGRLDKAPVNLSAAHYALFVQNWLAKPGPGQSLPLAVCRRSHDTLLARGRHVLFRDENGMHIDWLREADAAPMAARADQGARP